MKQMKKLLGLRREEVPVAVASLLVAAALNVLLVQSYPPMFTRGGKLGFWTIFYKHFCVSGFDAYSYIYLSNEQIYFELTRHPLFAAVLWPLYLLNQWLMPLTGTNWAVYLMAAALVLSATAAAVTVFRIFRRVMETGYADALLLTATFFSFASIMLTVMVPDHFCFSLLMLSLTLYIAGSRMKERKPLRAWQTALLFLFTAGITLSNGVKTGIASLFTNGRRTFAPKYFAVAFVLPLFIMAALAYGQYTGIIRPQAARSERLEKIHMAKDSNFVKRHEAHNRWLKANQGKAVADKPLLKWTDVTTPRGKSLVENLFGESVQLHRDHLLKDASQSRPVFVEYRHTYSYIVELVVVALFALGLWCGRGSRFVWLCMSCAGFDLLLHFVLGFGLNEVYIMGAHWMLVVPVAYACLLKGLRPKFATATRLLLLGLTLFLWAYNGTLIVGHFIQ
jgi:hypothetical protein